MIYSNSQVSDQTGKTQKFKIFSKIKKHQTSLLEKNRNPYKKKKPSKYLKTPTQPSRPVSQLYVPKADSINEAKTEEPMPNINYTSNEKTVNGSYNTLGSLKIISLPMSEPLYEEDDDDEIEVEERWSYNLLNNDGEYGN